MNLSSVSERRLLLWVVVIREVKLGTSWHLGAEPQPREPQSPNELFRVDWIWAGMKSFAPRVVLDVINHVDFICAKVIFV